ncbi:hypothetical protein HKD37_02G002997 [Glycine soja]
MQNLNLDNNIFPHAFQHKIVLSTPNLSSPTILDHLGPSCYQLSSTCDLSFLEEGNIQTSTRNIYSGWLQLLTYNVKILTLSSCTLELILKVRYFMRTQPPCFVRLESLKVKMNPYVEICDEEVNRVVECLLQNSPLTGVAVTNC